MIPMRADFLLACAAAFLALSVAPSQALDDSSARILFLGADIQLGDDAHTTLTVTFGQNSSVKEFSLPLFYEIQNLKADANFGNVSCISQRKAFGSQVDCAISPTPEKRMLTLDFDSFDLIKKADSQFLYKQEFLMPLRTESLSFKVSLPEGMFLTSGGSFQQYLPADGEKGSDGRKIFITWRRENLSAGDSFDTQVSYQTLPGNSQFFALFAGGLLGLGAVIVALVVGFWFFYKRFRNIKFVLPVLKSDEKKIMELLLRTKGFSNQKLLVRESNYSKAKVSKILNSLRERGIIRLEREGRSNKVFLEKDFSKKEAKEGENMEKQKKEGAAENRENVKTETAQKKSGIFKKSGYVPLRELKDSERETEYFGDGNDGGEEDAE